MTSGIKMGVVIGAQGLAGHVKIRAFTEDPMNIDAYGALTDGAGTPCKLKIIRATGDGCVIAAIEGVKDRNAAERLKGKEFFVEALPPAEDGAFYCSDLIGMKAVDVNGKAIGIVEQVHNYGAGDLLEIGGALYPFTGAVDLKAGVVKLNLPEETE
jgi:16S rRNA processing protein RimM